jgi:hypothetical protein
MLKKSVEGTCRSWHQQRGQLAFTTLGIGAKGRRGCCCGSAAGHPRSQDGEPFLTRTLLSRFQGMVVLYAEREAGRHFAFSGHKGVLKAMYRGRQNDSGRSRRENV